MVFLPILRAIRELQWQSGPISEARFAFPFFFRVLVSSRNCKKYFAAFRIRDFLPYELSENVARWPELARRKILSRKKEVPCVSSSTKMQGMCAYPSTFRCVSVEQLWTGRRYLASGILLPRSRNCKRRRRLPLVSANDQKAEEPGEGGSKGDQQVQDALVDMVRLQAGKLRVSEFVDERAKLLSDIADQAKEEYDKIAQDAMRTMDEASSKIISSVDAEAQAMEEELATARAQMEADSREFEEFEENVDKARSEGLFFKSLYSKPLKKWKERSAQEQRDIKKEAQVVYNVARKSGSSRSRRFLYGVLVVLLSLSLLETLSTGGDYPWPKLALYSFILVALVVQLTYESFVALDNGDGDDSKSER